MVLFLFCFQRFNVSSQKLHLFLLHSICVVLHLHGALHGSQTSKASKTTKSWGSTPLAVFHQLKRWIGSDWSRKNESIVSVLGDIVFTPSPIMNHGGKWLYWEGDYYWREPFSTSKSMCFSFSDFCWETHDVHSEKALIFLHKIDPDAGISAPKNTIPNTQCITCLSTCYISHKTN